MIGMNEKQDDLIALNSMPMFVRYTSVCLQFYTTLSSHLAIEA